VRAVGEERVLDKDRRENASPEEKDKHLICVTPLPAGCFTCSFFKH